MGESAQEQPVLRPRGHPSLERPVRELRGEQEAGGVERCRLVERTATRREEDGVLRAEQRQAQADRCPPPSRETQRKQPEGRSAQAQDEPLQAQVLQRRIGGEAGGRPESGDSRRYTRTTRAWRLNPLTPSSTAWRGTSSRHSTTGTPSAAYRVRSPSRRSCQRR